MLTKKRKQELITTFIKALAKPNVDIKTINNWIKTIISDEEYKWLNKKITKIVMEMVAEGKAEIVGEGKL